MKKAMLLGGLVVALAVKTALANPDVWVKTTSVYHIEDGAVTGLTVEWRFDPYSSNQTISIFDADGDGVFSAEEADQLRVLTFKPLRAKAFHLHVVVDNEPRAFTVGDFAPRIEDHILVFRFTARFDPPIRYTSEPLIVSFHDRAIVFDFTFAETDFLLVDGSIDPACRFRIGRGEGSLSGHARAVSILCGG